MTDSTMISADEAKQLSVSINNFSIALYEAVRSNSGNIIVSPISLHIVLAMALQGAEGSTANEIAKILDHPEDNEKVLEGYKALITELDSPVLKLASRIFIEKSIQLYPDYQTVVSKYFLSDVKDEDFSQNAEDARQEINSWVEEKTSHRIKDLLPEGVIDSLTRLVLVNGIHFKAKWLKQFDKSRTQEMPFHVTPQDQIMVQMMCLTNEKFRYMENPTLDAKIVELPYEGKEFSMIIILPNQIDGLTELENKLKILDISEELSGLYETNVDVFLPVFKVEQTWALNDILKKMGMSNAFGPEANFSRISNEPLVISHVIQKAFIEVNEEGTEAAAATGLVVMTRRKKIVHPVHCDHPFLFLILKDNVILFEGRFSEPADR